MLRPWIMRGTGYRRLSGAEEGDDCEYQEYEKQYFRDAGRTCGNPAEAENCGHDGDNEKDHCVVKHFCLPPPAIFCVGVVRRHIPIGPVSALSETAPLACQTGPTCPYRRYVAAVHFATSLPVLRLPNVNQGVSGVDSRTEAMIFLDGPIQ